VFQKTVFAIHFTVQKYVLCAKGLFGSIHIKDLTGVTPIRLAGHLELHEKSFGTT
jgi:hypothetical protein